jgi:hypothetical protein
VYASSLVQRIPQMAGWPIRSHKLQKDAIPRKLQKLDVGTLLRIVYNLASGPISKSARVNLGSSTNIFDQYFYVMQSQIVTAYVTATFLVFR